MTLGLSRFFRPFTVGAWLGSPAMRKFPALNLDNLSRRDIDDLNLPPDVAGKLGAARAARELRWKPFA